MLRLSRTEIQLCLYTYANEHPMLRVKLITLFILFATYSIFSQNNSQYVNVFIGTQGTGHTFPGASVPFGMVQPGPDNHDADWAYTSGYQYEDTYLLGFSQTHLNGTGIGELGDILMLPYASEAGKNSLLKETEQASPGYYTVTKADGVKTELTCTERVAYHRYTFPHQAAKLYINFQHGIRFLTDSLVLQADVKIEAPNRLSGYCHTKNWVERKYFFTIEFSQPFAKHEQLPLEAKEQAPKYIFDFTLSSSQQLEAKIALSTVSVAGAKNNLAAELPHWNFNHVHTEAVAKWNNYLNRIQIQADAKKTTLFYTALYHLLLQPANIADVDGQYRGADDSVATAPSKAYYSTLSNWDVYRTAFPLLALLAPDKIDPIVNSMLIHHKAAGFLPIWAVWGQDNFCMIGNHAIPMIVGAYSYGFNGFDAAEALQAVVETSTRDHIHSDWTTLNKYGYYPFDIVTDEAISKALENGYDDWCVAHLAEALGDKKNAAFFANRATFYKNTFDPQTKLFRGKDSQGNWRTPFNPLDATSPMNNPGDYTEANAWQYFWTPAQHDVKGVMKLLGGKSAFTKQLNDFFTIESINPDKHLGQEAMIGQYAHGNEPSHHIAYLYNYSNEPRTGQRYINQIINNFNNDTPDGMIGNDDCGQMSAWYILSSLGFYPLNPATNQFVFGAPQLEEATIYLANGHVLTVKANNFSAAHIYVNRVSFKGKKRQGFSISYQELMSGGTLQFEMSK